MSLKILFVEKDVTTADLLVPSLVRKGYQVSVAKTQRQAVSRSTSVLIQTISPEQRFPGQP